MKISTCSLNFASIFHNNKSSLEICEISHSFLRPLINASGSDKIEFLQHPAGEAEKKIQNFGSLERFDANEFQLKRTQSRKN